MGDRVQPTAGRRSPETEGSSRPLMANGRDLLQAGCRQQWRAGKGDDRQEQRHQDGLLNVNLILFFLGFWPLIEILQVKYLNNIIEQDHRFIKKITRPMKGFKAFHAASATLQGIEVAHMIRKRQFGQTNLTPFQQFATLAA